MLGDEFLASVNDDSVGFDTQFQQCSGVFERHSVAVRFEGDPAAVGGAHTAAAADIVTGQWQWLERWLFLLEEIAGTFARFAVEADVGYLLHPTARLSIECCQRADFHAAQEVLLDVTDGVLHAPFFVAPPDITGHRLEAVVSGKIQVARIKSGSLAGDALQHSALQIVVHGAPSASAKVF